MAESITNETFDIMRVGENAEARERRAQNARWVLGSVLSAAGLIQRGWLGAAAAAAGATVLINAAMTDTRLRRNRSTDRKSFDTIDKASLESFPASDPPSVARVD
jgi:hypothetical protein